MSGKGFLGLSVLGLTELQTDIALAIAVILVASIIIWKKLQSIPGEEEHEDEEKKKEKKVIIKITL